MFYNFYYVPLTTASKKSTARFNGKKCNYNNNVKSERMESAHHTTATKAKDQTTPPQTPLDAASVSGLKYSICPTSKNQEDPSRQIKFYDDFIDFRGDILRRPADSKNCRILWEYLYLLLQNASYASVIRWEDETQMVC